MLVKIHDSLVLVELFIFPVYLYADIFNKVFISYTKSLMIC
jgi:hypothetical protein